MGRWKLSLKLSLVFLSCMLALLVTFSSAVRANPAVIFSDGFESGDLSAWTGTTGTPVVQSAIKHSGTYAAQMSANGSRIYVSVGAANAYGRCYFRYDAQPATGEEYEVADLNILYAGTYLARALVVNSGGSIGWELKINDGGSTYQNFTNPPQVNTWYCVELWFSQNTPNGAALWVNGVQILTANVTTQDSPISYYEVKQYSTLGTSHNHYFDDVVVADSYIGPIAYQVTFDQTGLGSDFPGAVVTVDEVDYNFTQLPVSFSWNEFSSHTFAYHQSPLVVPPGVIRYLWNSTSGGLSESQSATLTISGPGSVVGNYVTQIYVGGEIINTPTLFNYLIIAAVATVAVAGVALLLRRPLISRFPKPGM